MPSPSAWLTKPPAVACGILALAFAAVGLGTNAANWGLIAASGIAGVLVVVLAGIVPWRKLPPSGLLVIALACDLVIAMLRQAEGGSASGYAPLVILPVLWVGLMFSKRGIAVMTVGTFLLFALPIVLIGAPLYPSTGWRGVVLWTAVVAVVGTAANRVTTAHRHDAALANARAEELARLVATQDAIATAPSDLDAVMSTIAEEATKLSGAEAAVVELPDGPDMVYRAVAGTAADHLMHRVRRNGSISGLALTEQRVLVCHDSETDPRVDREACRDIGARSMVVVPLWDGERAAGVLKVYSSTPSAFEPRAAQVLEMLAGMTAAALARGELLARLHEQATRDELTGLINRREWYRRLDVALVRARRFDEALSVIVLDVNGLKHVNDRDGHAAGDRLLRSISGRWVAALRESDVIGRIGGDEFAIVLERTGPVAAANVVDRLRAALDNGQSAAAGIATWDGVEHAGALLDRADEAMYRQKNARNALIQE